MLIPSPLFGPYKKVSAEIKKLYTAVLKGKTPEDYFSQFTLIDSDRHPESFFWLDRAWAGLGGADHFVLSPVFEPMFFKDKRITAENRWTIKRLLMNYFARSPWGTLVLNANQGYIWTDSELVPRGVSYSICPDSAATILGSTCAHWDEFLAEGNRFFRGGYDAKSFPGSYPLCYFVLAVCGFDTSEFPVEYFEAIPAPPPAGNVKLICEKYDIVNRLKTDENFREKARRGLLAKK
ncbi:MAG TPA: hypothetical protein VFU15_02075 [Bacteroidia bacterium]|nr:hypothetical protein [Bacteroidia bacterium]